MSIGLAIYGVDDVSPVAVFEMALRFFEKLNYSVTAAAFHKRIAPQRTADAESLDLVEVEPDELRTALTAGEATDFRIYSETGHSDPWFSSFGYTTENFGNFFCIDVQSEECFEAAQDKFTCFVDEIAQQVNFTYAIIYNVEKVSDAVWYARGDNMRTLFPFESPVAFSHDTPGLYEGERTYEKTKLRMVYPVNYLNKHHMSIRVDGIPLSDWIAMNPERGTLMSVSGKIRWTVPESALLEVNKSCGESGALLAWMPQKTKTRAKLP
ncbi:hypothetical protein [Pseudomonas sp. Irchel 3A5]|uniref:hypothetical protein n=1 Tax=Pseudomonas sp. Irchel 3A5 TaxID=2008911 RepID=UPI000BA462BA|nr:hypothetical protein [Pseudomonas sp. Irchel 3A5]